MSEPDKKNRVALGTLLGRLLTNRDSLDGEEWSGQNQLLAKPCDVIWDAHLCLNVLNRLSSRLAQDEHSAELVYALAEHLRFLAFAQNSHRLVKPAWLQEWMEAILGVHQLFFSGSRRTKCETSANGIELVEMQPLTATIVAALRLCGDVERLHIGLVPRSRRRRSADRIRGCQVVIQIKPAVIDKRLPGTAVPLANSRAVWKLDEPAGTYIVTVAADAVADNEIE